MQMDHTVVLPDLLICCLKTDMEASKLQLLARITYESRSNIVIVWQRAVKNWKFK